MPWHDCLRGLAVGTQKAPYKLKILAQFGPGSISPAAVPPQQTGSPGNVRRRHAGQPFGPPAAPPLKAETPAPKGNGGFLAARLRCYLAFSRISTSRQFLVADSGRVSAMTTRSPMPAVFCSSCALTLEVRRMTLP